MRKDTTFSDRKLTEKEFSDKYWMHGEFPYQYHTASIEDGRDEREQFLFNNCRALWERMNREGERRRNGEGAAQVEIEQLRETVAKQQAQIERLERMISLTLFHIADKLAKPTQDGCEISQEGNNAGQAAREFSVKVSDGSPGESDVVCRVVSRVDIKKAAGLQLPAEIGDIFDGQVRQEGIMDAGGITKI